MDTGDNTLFTVVNQAASSTETNPAEPEASVQQEEVALPGNPTHPPVVGETMMAKLSEIEIDSSLSRHIDGETVEALKVSLTREGQLYPVLIKRKEGGGFSLVAGEHRFRAAAELGWESIKATVLEGDFNTQVINLLENFCRSELSPVDRATGVAKLKRECRFLKDEDVASFLGVSRPTIVALNKVAALPRKVQRYANEHKASLRALLAAAKGKNEEEQLDTLKAYVQIVRLPKAEKRNGSSRKRTLQYSQAMVEKRLATVQESLGNLLELIGQGGAAARSAHENALLEIYRQLEEFLTSE